MTRSAIFPVAILAAAAAHSAPLATEGFVANKIAAVSNDIARAVAPIARGVASNELAIASTARQVASNETAIASHSSQLSQLSQSLAGKVDKGGDYITVSNAAKNAIQTIELGGQTLPRDQMSHDKVSIPVTAPSSDVSLIGTPADTYYTYIALLGKANPADIPPAVSNVVTKSYVEDLGISADFSTSNTELVTTIKATAPAPGDYSTVSNKAMTALQSFTETDPTVSSWAKAATKPSYSWNEIGSKPSFATVATSGNYNDLSNKPTIPTVPANVSAFNNDAGYLTGYTETDPTVKSWAKAATKPTYTASEVGAATTEDVYRLITGTNVVLVITNYNSAVHAPSMKLQHLDPDTNEYVTYWDETRRHGLTLTNAMDYADAAAAAEVTRADAAYAPRAWSRTTSGLGADAPDGVTWISTPETVIAGGFEYEKVITTAGAVWVLTSNGMTTGATTNSYFRVSASDGTELFSIEKTDSYLVGVDATGITKSGNTVTIPVNVVAPSHPYTRATTNLVNAVWTKEDENGFSCPFASVSWSGTSGAYVATVTTSQPESFFYFEFEREGTAKIKQSAATELSGGIIFNGTTYMPTVNGNKLEFIAQ